VRVDCFHDFAELERYCADWDALAADCVFRGWTWLNAWWRHYGAGDARRDLSVILAFHDDSPTPAAIFPAYLERTLVRGGVLQLLGDGETCSDHLGLLAAPSTRREAAAAIADWLMDFDDWDLIDLVAIDAEDESTCALAAALEERDCAVATLAADRCWAIDLPRDWEEFLALQSKSHRKQLRQLERRVLSSDRAHWVLVESADQFDDAWATLVELHQRRRQSLGQPGCFASPRWAAFHREAARALLDESRLRLSHLNLDGRPVAAEYHLAGNYATYAYQGGVDPDRLTEEPGQLSTLCSIRRALAEGHRRFDFLRGDEPYKAHWRAQPHDAVRLQAAPPRGLAQWRHRTWTQARRWGQLAKQLTPFGADDA